MFIDNKDFYPTPKNLINKMLSSVDLTRIKTILEPSAGKGDIVDVLQEKNSGNKKYSCSSNSYQYDIDCIEKDANLQHILKGKDFRVVHDDFLTYDSMKEYDLIIMNPPFSDGDKHLLKAIEMQQRNGGGIVCMVNAETLKNPNTNAKKDLFQKLNEYNAKIEYLENEFIDAERKTNVEIALIKVILPEQKIESFIIEGLQKAKEHSEYTEQDQNSVIGSDFVTAIVEQYKMELQAGISLIKEYYAMSPFILSEFSKDGTKGNPILNLGLYADRYDNHTSKLSVNDYITTVRAKYWSALFKNEKFTGKLTSNLKRDYYNNVGKLSQYDFSLFNIKEIKAGMQSKMVKGVEDTIVSLFDEFSQKHSWYDETSKNIHLYNGWKTNKSWYINKKVIILLDGYGHYFNGNYYPTNYKVVDKLEDIEKALNYLDNGSTENVNIQEALKFAEEYQETKKVQLKYFMVTFYKKGTCHIEFTNLEILKKFNIFGSQQKGWLPPSYGKSTYCDMTAEEKSVVDDFEGENAYKETMNNTKYYLFNSNSVILLEENIV